MFLTLFNSIVGPHLEYGSNVWSMIYKKEAMQIENLQRRATTLVQIIQHLSYTERLKYLILPSLQYRRLRAHMVETFKILYNIDKVQHERIFPMSRTATRGHNQKIYKKNSRTNISKYSFSQRRVDMWNCLPKQVIETKTVNTLKSQLNNHWQNLEI